MSSLDPLALPFDQYQRYAAAAQIADEIRAYLGRPCLRVLDVGGFSRTQEGHSILPLAHFLPKDRVAGVDLVAESMPGYALASGLSLPFGCRSFDLVISCDTLEHIVPSCRAAFVDELLRVTNEFLVLIAPFDSEANRRAERILHDYLTAQGMISHPLEEHLERGLPSLDSLQAQLAGRGLAALDLPDGYLPHWLAMMLTTLTPKRPQSFHQVLNRYYNRYFSPHDRREPAYRRVLLVAQPGNEALLPAVAHSFHATETPSVAAELGFTGDLIELLAQSQAPAPETRSRLCALETENARLRRLVASYERGRFIRTMGWVHKQRNRLRRYLLGKKYPQKGSISNGSAGT
jgi:hypothetical protein